MIQNKTERLVYRLLFLDPPTAKDDSVDSPASAERAFGFSLMFSAVRCILMYVVLPFVLPVVGVTLDAAVPLMMVINVVAIVSILYSVRRFWQVDYKYKWSYLPIAAVALVLLVAFIVLDLQMLAA